MNYSDDPGLRRTRQFDALDLLYTCCRLEPEKLFRISEGSCDPVEMILAAKCLLLFDTSSLVSGSTV